MRDVLQCVWLLPVVLASLLVCVPAAWGMVDCARAESCEAQRGRVYVVAAIGDSLTDQRVGGGRYLSLLSERCPESRFDAYGVGGQRTNHMRWRFLHDVFGEGVRGGSSKPSYTHVIVLGGVNDLSAAAMRGVDLGDIQKNLSYMYGAAQTRGVEVVAVTLPPWGYVPGGRDGRPGATRRLNAWIAAQGEARRVGHVVDVHPLLSCGDVDALCPRFRIWADDAIHWNGDGHAVVAEALSRAVFSDCR